MENGKWKNKHPPKIPPSQILTFTDPIPHFLVIHIKFCYIFRSPKRLIKNSVKHLLLILISLLLLSSPVIGNNHKGETLYGWGNPSGDGWVWMGFGKIETHPKYQGQVKNGKPNGLDFIIYPSGEEYVWSWGNGK